MRLNLHKTLVSAAVGLALGLTGLNAHAAEWTWKVQSLWQPGTTNQKAFERFAAMSGIVLMNQQMVVPVKAFQLI